MFYPLLVSQIGDWLGMISNIAMKKTANIEDMCIPFSIMATTPTAIRYDNLYIMDNQDASLSCNHSMKISHKTNETRMIKKARLALKINKQQISPNKDSNSNTMGKSFIESNLQEG